MGRVRMEGMRTLTKHFPSLDRMFEEARSIPESVIWEGAAKPAKDMIKQQFVTKERPLHAFAPGRPCLWGPRGVEPLHDQTLSQNKEQ